MVKTKELIICIVSIIALILAITTNVFATEPVQDVGTLLGIGNNTNNTTNEDEFGQIGGTVNPTNTTNNLTNTTNNLTNTNSNNNTTNTMPNTGISYSSLTVIAIAGISAVYAYKKIKEYNV